MKRTKKTPEEIKAARQRRYRRKNWLAVPRSVTLARPGDPIQPGSRLYTPNILCNSEPGRYSEWTEYVKPERKKPVKKAKIIKEPKTDSGRTDQPTFDFGAGKS